MLIKPGMLIKIFYCFSAYTDIKASVGGILVKNHFKNFDENTIAILLQSDYIDQCHIVTVVIQGKIYFMRALDLYDNFVKLCKVS